MIKFFKEEVTGVRFNGSLDSRYPGNLNVTFEKVQGELLMEKLSPLALSTGSACLVSEEASISYVLEAIGVKPDFCETHIRFGLGRFTTEEEVDYTLNLVNEKVKEVRE
jgi:cysteine desulfurase